MKKNIFIKRSASFIVILCFTCNIFTVGYARAEEWTKSKELNESRASISAYSASELVSRQNMVEQVVSGKNDFIKASSYIINKNYARIINKDIPSAPSIRIGSDIVNHQFDASAISAGYIDKLSEISLDKNKTKTHPDNFDKDLLGLTNGNDEIPRDKAKSYDDRWRALVDDLRKQAEKLEEIKGIADAIGIRSYDMNDDGKLDDKDIARMKKFFEDAEEYAPRLSRDTFRNIDINGDGRIDDKDFQTWCDAMQEEKNKPAEVQAFVDDLIKELLDINKDGLVNELDGIDPDTYRYYGNFDFIFMSHTPRGGLGTNYGYPEDETERLLKYVWFKLLQNNNGTWDIGGKFQVNKTGEGRWDMEIVISNGEWMLIMTNPEPPGVDTGTIRTMTTAYDNLEQARKRAEEAFAVREFMKRRAANNISLIEKEKAEKESNIRKEKEAKIMAVIKEPLGDKKPEAALVQPYKKTENPIRNKGLDQASATDLVTLKNADMAISVKEGSLRSDPASRAAEVAPESDEAVKTEWHDNKESFIETFDRIAAEEPGAVYSAGNAVILLSSTAEGAGNNDNKGKEGEGLE